MIKLKLPLSAPSLRTAAILFASFTVALYLFRRRILPCLPKPLRHLLTAVGLRFSNTGSSDDDEGRFIIKLGSSCTLDERIAAKVLASRYLGGESALRAIEEGPRPLLQLIAIDRHFRAPPALSDGGEGDDALPPTGVVGSVLLKEGWQDTEFESCVGKVVRTITKNSNGNHNSDDDDAAAAVSAAAALEAASSTLLGKEMVPVILAEAAARAKAQQQQMSPSTVPRGLMCAEINWLAVDEAFRGQKLGATLVNLAGAVACCWGVLEVQGNAANRSLVGFYLNKCAPPVLDKKVVERDQYFSLATSDVGVKAELHDRWRNPNRLPKNVVLDEELRQLLERGRKTRLEVPRF